MLRGWRDEDVAAVDELSGDPVVMEYLAPLPGGAGAGPPGGARFRAWIVEIPGEATFIGVVGLSTVSYEAHCNPGS